MRRVRLVLLALGCLALVGTVALQARPKSEEETIEALLGDLPLAARDGDEATWAWLRTGPVPHRDVENHLAERLRGRKGWSHNAMGWNYNPYAVGTPWWAHLRFLGGRLPDRRPILWVVVSDGRAILKGDATRPEGPWTTVRLKAMASCRDPSRLLSGWAVQGRR